MKRDVRQEILRQAKQLFNEHGFNAVSTGDIAGALGISKGHLTYYFKKKENIIEAIILETPISVLPATPTSLAELNAFLLHIQSTIQENAFYFWHHAQLSQLSPAIRDRQTQVYQRNLGILLQVFHTLAESGILRAEQSAGEYHHVIDTLLLSITYWLPFCALKQERPTSSSFLTQAWSIMRNLLTEQGQAALAQMPMPEQA